MKKSLAIFFASILMLGVSACKGSAVDEDPNSIKTLNVFMRAPVIGKTVEGIYESSSHDGAYTDRLYCVVASETWSKRTDGGEYVNFTTFQTDYNNQRHHLQHIQGH